MHCYYNLHVKHLRNANFNRIVDTPGYLAHAFKVLEILIKFKISFHCHDFVMNLLLYLFHIPILSSGVVTSQSVMTLIGEWFKSSTVSLVTTQEFLNSLDFHTFRNNFPTSPFLLEVNLFVTLNYTERHPLVQRNKRWLSAIAMDSTQYYLLYYFLRTNLIFLRNENPEYFLLYSFHQIEIRYFDPIEIVGMQITLKILIVQKHVNLNNSLHSLFVVPNC